MESYYKTADVDWYRQRLNGIMIAIFAAFAILLMRLFYLQIIEGEEYRRLSDNNCIRLKSIDASRGLIFDRNRDLLVDNRPSFDLSIILKDAKPLDETLNKLSVHIGMTPEEIRDAIKRHKGRFSYQPILIKSDIGRDTLAAVEANKFDLPGIAVDIRPLRHYIHPQSASHLLGYLGQINTEELRSGKYPEAKGGDYIGKFGMEKIYQNYLTGKRGGQQVEVNATGQTVRVLKSVQPKPGHNIFLTIDYKLQALAETLLEGEAGAVVAMDPNNGHVLALASSPSFDQNAFVSGLSSDEWNSLISNPLRPMTNKAIQGLYPPASTYKIVSAIAGLEEGIIDPETSVLCPGYLKYGDRVFRCWKRWGHGNMDLTDAIAQSCDVYFYQLGQKINIDRLAWYAKACGLGQKTGIKLDHEAAGLVPTAAWKKKRFGTAWQGGETLSIIIGQGYNLATPLQMAVLTAAVANGGVRMKPLVLKSIETVEGKTVYQSKSEKLGVLPASRETLQHVKQGLWHVVNEQRGTAGIARIPGLDVCGKTGTAQVISRRKNEIESEEEYERELKPHGWFVAYAPCESPSIAISVIVEHGEHGSSAGGPIARELIKLYLSKEIAARNKVKEVKTELKTIKIQE